MPIARLPVDPSVVINRKVTTILYPDIEVPFTIPADTAVAVIDNAGTQEYALCGALAGQHPTRFAGFMAREANPGDDGILITGRGSQFTPIVEGGGALTPGADVFLATTVGQVTHTPPDPVTYPGSVVMRVGFAVSTTEIILSTDAHWVYGG